MALSAEVQPDVALVTLPMASRQENALIVNALQRSSSLVVQNSLREGFGLTCTEAMWKQTPVLGTRAFGLRRQIRDGLDGRLIPDATDAGQVASFLEEMLNDEEACTVMSRNAQRRVHHDFLIFTQIRNLLETLVACRRSTR